MSILISGSLAYDKIMSFPGKFRDHFHEDKMHALSVSFVVSTLQQSFGGTAGNIAYNLSLLGEKPRIVAAVGGDFGEYWGRLQKLGVDTSLLQREEDIPTAVGHIITDQEDNQITAFYAGAMARPYVRDSLKADLAIVAAGNPIDMMEMPRKFRSNGSPFIYDVGQGITSLSGDDLRDALHGATAFMGNDYEIGAVMKKTNWDHKEMLQHVGMIVTTLGADGSLVSTKGKEYKIAPVKAIQVIDPTGAGDAYRAGFAAAWIRKLTPDVCAKVASCVAVYAVESYGTQKHAFTMEQLKKRYEETYGEEFPLRS